ncbi:MAG: flagellar basal-body rod protein FlgF [Rhizobiales bacterium]|nr:flagellar basal-body rod protein FlgF [Hyphomicrobiales bacterium]
MNNAIRIGLSQQAALKRQLSTVANNLANMSTAGFKTENLVFQEYIMPVAKMNNQTLGSKNLSYVSDVALMRDFGTGSMEVTDNPLDVAINGEGWFSVQTPNGKRYTRDGHFSLNSEGQLVNLSGHPVLTDGGPINFTQNESEITIAKDGSISTNLGQKGKLLITVFDDQRLLQKEGDNLFNSPVEGREPEFVSLAQGMIEKSNVQPVVQMTKMIEIQRAYERTSNMIKKMADLKSSAINKLAQVAG